MFEGMRKDDPATTKQLPVEADVPELLVKRGLRPGATELERAVGDWATNAFYFLLRIGEYTVKGKGTRPNETQTQQFRMKDVIFFRTSSTGKIYQLPRNARKYDIESATSATLLLTNQKNGWKGVCINHEHNGDDTFCAIRALGRRYLHIRDHTTDYETMLSAYFIDGVKYHVTYDDIKAGLKWAATTLDYPNTRGIPLSLINTHSLRIGGACALALAGYSDTEIQKMGRWRGVTFKEYIRENLSNYSEGMSRAMKKVHGFVNVGSGAFTDVTAQCVNTAYGAPIQPGQKS